MTDKKLTVYTPLSVSTSPLRMRYNDAEMAAKVMGIQCGVPLHAFFYMRNSGRHLSRDILPMRPCTPMKEVSVAPLSTMKASTATTYASQVDLASFSKPPPTAAWPTATITSELR